MGQVSFSNAMNKLTIPKGSKEAAKLLRLPIVLAKFSSYLALSVELSSVH